MHFSAKRGIAIACRLSVCLSVTVDQDHIGWKSLKLSARTISEKSIALRSLKATHLLPGKFWGDKRGGIGKSGVLEHKSGNISEKRKYRRKVTMEGL